MTGILDRHLDLVLDSERDRPLRIGSRVDLDRVKRNSTLSTLISRNLRLIRRKRVEPTVFHPARLRVEGLPTSDLIRAEKSVRVS